MKILIVSAIMPPDIGGPATYVPEMVSRLSDVHDFRIITLTKNPTRFDKAPVIPVAQNQLALVREIAKNINWCDVIYAQDPLVVGVASVLVGKIFQKKVIVRYGGDPAWESAQREARSLKNLPEFIDNPNGGLKSFVDIQLTRLSFSLMDVVIVNSNFLKDIVVGRYRVNAGKVMVIKNAVSIASKIKRFHKKKVYELLCLGRLVPWKGVAGVIKAAMLLNRRNKIKVRLTVIGDGPEKKNLEKYSATNLVRFLPAVSHTEALKALGRSDVYILNSAYEGSPNQVIEAFAVGTPVVATNIPGTNEIAINNQTAITIPVGDIGKLAEAIEQLLTDREIAAKITNGARELIKDHTWEKHLAQLYKLFGELVRND